MLTFAHKLTPDFPALLATLNEDDRLWIEERAAIREYDGGYDRQEAERLAVEDFHRRQAQEIAE